MDLGVNAADTAATGPAAASVIDLREQYDDVHDRLVIQALTIPQALAPLMASIPRPETTAAKSGSMFDKMQSAFWRNAKLLLSPYYDMSNAANRTLPYLVTSHNSKRSKPR